MGRLYGGYTNYGQDIGVLMLDTQFPRIPGDIGNNFSYPGVHLRYKMVKNALGSKICTPEPDPEMIKPFIEAAKELEAEGCKAITTSCGYLLAFQEVLAKSVNIPVFTSGIMLVPLVRTMMGPEAKIAILTERPWNLNPAHFPKIGFDVNTDKNIVISGMREGSAFPALFIDNNLEEDEEVLRDCMLLMAKDTMEKHPDTKAIVFECTNFGPWTKDVSDYTGVPVFGINQLLEFVASCVRPRYYK